MWQIGESMAEKGKVLIVDDKQIERVMLKKILSDTYEVVEAENGKKAFEILYERSEEITAVLLDIVMPEYDGYYFLERYHKAQMYQAIPVVVLILKQKSDVLVWGHGILYGNRIMWMLSGFV